MTQLLRGLTDKLFMNPLSASLSGALPAAQGALVGAVVRPPDVSGVALPPSSPIAARSSDCAGMRRFFRSIGVAYTPHLKLKDRYALRTAMRAAARFDSICAYYERSPILRDSEPGKTMLAARHGSFDRPGKEYPVADLYICRIGDEIGYGCFAAGDIAKGGLLGEYTGILLARGSEGAGTEYHMRPNPWEMMSHPEEGIASPAMMLVCAEKAGNEMRFINHVCESMIVGGTSMAAENVAIRCFYTFEVFSDGNDMRRFCNFFHILFFASRDITAGEELRFDYGEGYWIHHGRSPDNSCVYKLDGGRLVKVRLRKKRQIHRTSRMK